MKPTGVRTNGMGQRTTSHLNLTVSIADADRLSELQRRLTKKGKAPYAGKEHEQSEPSNADRQRRQ